MPAIGTLEIGGSDARRWFDSVLLQRWHGLLLSPHTTIHPTDNAQDSEFGYSLDLDGDRLVVGAKRENESRGAIYVFELIDDTWTGGCKAFPHSKSAYDFTGNSVAISGDTITVGSPGYDLSSDSADWDTGRVFIYRHLSLGGYGEQLTLQTDRDMTNLVGLLPYRVTCPRWAHRERT